MCGIFGYTGKDPFDLDKIKILALYNQSRGDDATGFYNGKELIKKAEKASKFIETLQLEETNILIGHCRKATSTWKLDKHAHPFQHNNIVGVHNGVISNSYQLARDRNISLVDIDVDSDILFKIISNEENYDILKKYNGAAAIMTIDKQDVLTIFRDDDRPLHYSKVLGTDNYYFSSMPESLKAIGFIDIKDVTPEVLFKIKNGKMLSQTSWKREIIIPTITVGRYAGYKKEQKPISNDAKIGDKIRGVYGVYDDITCLTYGIITRINRKVNGGDITQVVFKCSAGSVIGQLYQIDNLNGIELYIESNIYGGNNYGTSSHNHNTSCNHNISSCNLPRNRSFNQQVNDIIEGDKDKEDNKHPEITRKMEHLFKVMEAVRDQLFELKDNNETLGYNRTSTAIEENAEIIDKLINYVENETLTIFNVKNE